MNNLNRIIFFQIALFSSVAIYPSSTTANFILPQNDMLGINNSNLSKIEIGIIDLGLKDSDQDGLDDELESAIGTSPLAKDSDKDGYNDKNEVQNNYNPIGKGKIVADKKLAKKLSGKFLLQVEKKGQLWYVNPSDLKRYYLGNESRFKKLADKFNLSPAKPATTTSATNNENQLLTEAAAAIRANDSIKLENLCEPGVAWVAKYNMNYLKDLPEARLSWANIVSGANLTSSSETEKVYINNFYVNFARKTAPIEFRTKKQSDGTWLISKI